MSRSLTLATVSAAIAITACGRGVPLLDEMDKPCASVSDCADGLVCSTLGTWQPQRPACRYITTQAGFESCPAGTVGAAYVDFDNSRLYTCAKRCASAADCNYGTTCFFRHCL